MKDMTTGRPFTLILRFALPLLLGNILQQLYNVADAAIVGRFLGPKALAAVGATGSVQFLILGFCIGCCTGFCIPLSQSFGAKDERHLRVLLFNSILLTIFLAVLVTSTCVLLCPQILRLLSTPADIWDDTYIYIFVIFLGIPFTLLYNLAAGILRSVGDSRTPFVFLAVSTALNIGLDYFCIAILGWGCAGAAIATIASQALSGILCAAVIIRRYEVLHIREDERRVDREGLASLLMMGVPMGMQFSITAIGSMVLQSANNSLGSLYASAFTAAMRIKMFAMCPFDAVGSAVTTFCSQNYGAGRYSRIREGYRLGAWVNAIYGLMVGVCLIFFGRSLCLIFLPAKEASILDAAARLLSRGGCFFWVLGILNVTRPTVQGLGYSGRVVLCGVMEMIARIGVVAFLMPRYGFGAICLADPAAWIAADLYIIPTCMYIMRKWDEKIVSKCPTFHREIYKAK